MHPRSWTEGRVMAPTWSRGQIVVLARPSVQMRLFTATT